MSGSLPSHFHPPGRSGPKRILHKLLRRNRVGVNVAPGDQDDGWESPPGTTLADGSSVQLYKDGEALRHAYDAIAAAKSRICFEFYIWDDDATGRAFADLLLQKAREGVNVYIIYDSFGVWAGNDRSMFDRLRKAGARVAEFHPIRPWECDYGWRPYSRDHRKLVVVDDNFAGVGGLNIADPYAGAWVAANKLKPTELWRDTGIGVTGPAARMFLGSFVRTWNYICQGGRIVRAMHTAGIELPRSPKGNRVGKAADTDAPPATIMKPDSIAVLATVPTLASPLRPLLHDLIASAKSSIRMTMAYFAPDDQLVGELCDAARRGVKVQLMFGAKSDLPIMVTAARAFYERMLCSGIEIYERQYVILHAKTAVVDEHIGVVGSTNLDYRSIEFNCEISAIVRSDEFARGLTELFRHDMRFAKLICRDAWQRRSWRDRLIQWGVSRLRYLL
jgi:cardiolipin synthase